MLKHASHRSSSSPLAGAGADESFRQAPDRDPDNVSLVSTRSLVSLGSSRRSPSVCSLAIADHGPAAAAVPVKIYLRRLRSDMEYKTVSLSLRTTCRELVTLLLNKFRLRHRDPNLFFVLMEVTVRAPSDGAPVRRQLVLDDSARPAELQQCRPKGEANFSIGVRRGGLLRVHDAILNPGSQYKSLMVSLDTTANELVQMLLDGYNNQEDPKHYCLHVVRKSLQGSTESDKPLEGSESPLRVQMSWPKDGSRMFVLRRNISFTLSMKSRLSWRRSLDHSGSDTESECDDHDTTRVSIMSSSSTLSSGSSSSSSSGVSSTFSSSASSSSSTSSGVFSEEGSPEASPPAKPPPPPASAARRPPRPVPRTLFPPRERSASTATLTKDAEEQPPSGPKSAGRSGLSLRALSKSSLNLNFVSPLARNKSRSFLSLLGGDWRTSTPRRPPTPVGAKDPLLSAPPCACRHCFYI